MNFVKVVRAVELILGIPVPGAQLASKITTSNFTAAIGTATSTNSNDIFNDEVKSALQAAAPILAQIAVELSIPTIFNFNLASAPVHNQRSPLVTKYVFISYPTCFQAIIGLFVSFMDINWQFNSPANPADAQIGPQGYDNHLYYSFGVREIEANHCLRPTDIYLI